MAEAVLELQEAEKWVPSHRQRVPRWRQVLAGCVCHAILVQAGVNLSFSAVLLPQLGGRVSLDEASWIASVVALSLPLGSALLGPLVDRFGRKRVCLLSNLPYFAGWAVMLCETGAWTFCAGRFLCGFAAGLTMVSLIYVSEITHPSIRGMMLSLNSVFVSFGILLTCLLGFALRWQTMLYVFAFTLAVNMIALTTIPESPHWLVAFRNDALAAKAALNWLYSGDAVAVADQLAGLVGSAAPVAAQRTGELRRALHQPVVYKPFAILVTLFIFQQITGAYVVIFYALDIFRRMVPPSNGARLDSLVALVLLGAIRFCVSVVSALISTRVGRRPLFFISSLGMAAASAVAGAACGPLALGHLAVGGVLAYVSFSSLAYLIIPWTLIGELLPVRVKGTLGGGLISFAYILMFLTVKVFPFLVDAVDLSTLFYTLSVVNAIGFYFLYTYLPETLGKTLQDIVKHFEN